MLEVPTRTIEDARALENYALRFATKNGHVDCLKYLSEGFGLTEEDARAMNNSALKIAARNGYLDCLTYLREGFGLTQQ